MIVDAGEHVGEPGLRIDVVELGRLISVGMTAARSPPRSEPANSQDFRAKGNLAVILPISGRMS